MRCGKRKRDNLVNFVIFEKTKIILIESREMWELVKVKNKLRSLFLISNKKREAFAIVNFCGTLVVCPFSYFV